MRDIARYSKPLPDMRRYGAIAIMGGRLRQLPFPGIFKAALTARRCGARLPGCSVSKLCISYSPCAACLGAGAIQYHQGWGCSLCRWWSPTTREGGGIPGGSGKTGGVSRARYRTYSTHPLPPFQEISRYTLAAWQRGRERVPQGGSGKSGGGIFRHKCENICNPLN